jgi:hypothetical protein
MLLAIFIIGVVILGVIMVYNTRGLAMAMAIAGITYKQYPTYFDQYQFSMTKEMLDAQIMPMLETLLEPMYDVNLIQKGHQLVDAYCRNDKTIYIDDLYAELMEVKEQLETRYNSLILINQTSGTSSGIKGKYNDRANNLYYKKEYIADYAQYHANETSYLIDSIQQILV